MFRVHLKGIAGVVAIQREGRHQQRAIDADRILLTFDGRHEAAIISYRLEGQVSDGAMGGTALLGAASDQNQGIVNRTQFGAGAWRAERVA